MNWLTKKWVGVSLHVLFWALYLASAFHFRPLKDADLKWILLNYDRLYYVLFLNNIMRLLLFYANAYWFIPRLVYKKKYGQYLFVLLLALATMMGCDRLFSSLPW